MTKEDRQKCVRDAVQNNPQKYVGRKLIWIVQELQPDLVKDIFFGGVYGCPCDIFRMENICPDSRCATEGMCIRCWRRVYPGKEVNK